MHGAYFAVGLVLTLCPVGVSLAADRVLTVDGKTSQSQVYGFTMADLEAMPQATIETGTPWHQGVVEFVGVPLAKLMEEVGAVGETAYITALNDYAVEVPISDFSEFGVILATKADGAYMPISDKGPLFVVYPFDSEPELQSEAYLMRAVWQVKSITIE